MNELLEQYLALDIKERIRFDRSLNRIREQEMEKNIKRVEELKELIKSHQKDDGNFLISEAAFIKFLRYG